ncbi:MAG: hypothetical protein J5628_05745 [Lachnospiraceae bacterium]|nr:hypothetical protein [Lachnospiraceae bacterium]
MYIVAEIGLLRFPGEALGFKRKYGLQLREYSGIWGFLISAVLDKKVRACGNSVPEKNTRPFAKSPFGRFCSCGRAVTAFPQHIFPNHAIRKNSPFGRVFAHAGVR